MEVSQDNLHCQTLVTLTIYLFQISSKAKNRKTLQLSLLQKPLILLRKSFLTQKLWQLQWAQMKL